LNNASPFSFLIFQIVSVCGASSQRPEVRTEEAQRLFCQPTSLTALTCRRGVVAVALERGESLTAVKQPPRTRSPYFFSSAIGMDVFSPPVVRGASPGDGAAQAVTALYGGWRVTLSGADASAGDGGAGLCVNVEWVARTPTSPPSAPAIPIEKVLSLPLPSPSSYMGLTMWGGAVQLFFRPPIPPLATKRKREDGVGLEMGPDDAGEQRPHKASRPAGDDDDAAWCDLHQVNHSLVDDGDRTSPLGCRRGDKSTLTFDNLPTEVQCEIFLRLPMHEVRTSYVAHAHTHHAHAPLHMRSLSLIELVHGAVQVMATLPLVCSQWREMAYDETLWHSLHSLSFGGPKTKPGFPLLSPSSPPSVMASVHAWCRVSCVLCRVVSCRNVHEKRPLGARSAGSF
jgi:hypothetical protein